MQDSSVSGDVDENVAVLAIFGVFAAVDESTALQHAFVKRGVKVDVDPQKSCAASWRLAESSRSGSGARSLAMG
jgi:hypothetical protein